MKIDLNSTLDLLCNNAQVVIDREGLERKLREGKKLRIKLGVDPTRPDLTFGHMVVFNKLRQFQDLGHQAVFLIGDFTTRIGDPTGRSDTRPMLTPEQIQENSKTYLDQAFKILDKDKVEVRYNSEWYAKMSLADLLTLSRELTVAQLIERDDFAKRYASKTPISLVEFLYPLIQGYDSVMLQSDLELGGNDQLFNMLVGRALQKNRGLSEQAVMCMPLIVGLDGQRKMSKSYNNYIAFNDSARDMFGKIMSIPDEIMETYFRLLLCESPEQIQARQSQHPMEMKKQLAMGLVAKFFDDSTAQKEREHFETVFSKNEIPQEMPEFSIEKVFAKSDVSLVEFLVATKAFPSKKEIRRLIEQGAVRIDGQKISDIEYLVSSGTEHVIQVGKRQFFRTL